MKREGPAAGRSKVYLDWVRQHPCASCQSDQGTEAHHFFEGEGGMSLKCSDYHTVPLCPRCHRFVHDNGTLPGMNRERTLILVYRTEARLLNDWLTVF